MSTVTGWRKRTIMEMAQESGGMFSELPLMDAWVFGEKSLEAFAALVREDEREKCAKRLDAVGCDHCATNIRARGQE